MTLQSERGQAFEDAARQHCSTPRARQAVELVDIPQRRLTEFGGGRDG